MQAQQCRFGGHVGVIIAIIVHVIINYNVDAIQTKVD